MSLTVHGKHYTLYGVCSSLTNFILRAKTTENCDFDQVLKFWSCFCAYPSFSDQGQIRHTILGAWRSVACRISPSSTYTVTHAGQKPHPKYRVYPLLKENERGMKAALWANATLTASSGSRPTEAMGGACSQPPEWGILLLLLLMDVKIRLQLQSL